MSLWARLRPGARPAGDDECRRVGRLIQAYLDVEIDGPSTEEVTAHLAVCRRCGFEAESIRLLKEALRRQGLPDPQSAARLRSFAEALARGEMDDRLDHVET